MFGTANIVAAPAGRLLVHLGRRYREDHYVREIALSVGLGVGPVSEARASSPAGITSSGPSAAGTSITARTWGAALCGPVKLAATLAELDELPP